MVDEDILKKRHKEEIELEKKVLKRMKAKEGKTKKQKIQKANKYVILSNKLFSKISLERSEKFPFKGLKKDLVQANMTYLPISYISMILMTTLISVGVAFLIFLFFMFFSFGIKFPFIGLYDGNMASRFIQIFWILLAIPIGTFYFVLSYPSLEKNSLKNKINQELPFVTIHMASIAGSMVEPSKMFKIIMMTEEYPHTSKEFTKIINEIHIYGYNLVAALRKSAANTASDKLRDLFNGLATTVTTGGSLEKFFEKRSQTLLFDYKLEREKYTRIAETFMDIYISVVIAAPLILMLLLMMIRISGLGISITTQMITTIMVVGVSLINVGFLMFLKLRQPKE